MPPFTLKAVWLRRREAWSRRSGLATVTVYFAAVEAGLLAVRAIMRVLKPADAALGGWIVFVGFCLFVCAFGLGFRWFRRMVMWRLRNRLIITYMFIGVIPVV